MCLPIPRPEPNFKEVKMVLVAPLPPENNWNDVIEDSNPIDDEYR